MLRIKFIFKERHKILKIKENKTFAKPLVHFSHKKSTFLAKNSPPP